MTEVASKTGAASAPDQKSSEPSVRVETKNPVSSAAASEKPAPVERKKESERRAFVLLVMKGDAYVPGALVAAYSLRLTGSSADLVCMVTPDVTETARKRLAVAFTKVVCTCALAAWVNSGLC